MEKTNMGTVVTSSCLLLILTIVSSIPFGMFTLTLVIENDSEQTATAVPPPLLSFLISKISSIPSRCSNSWILKRSFLDPFPQITSPQESNIWPNFGGNHSLECIHISSHFEGIPPYIILYIYFLIRQSCMILLGIEHYPICC